jgi:hypothetical protein
MRTLVKAEQMSSLGRRSSNSSGCKYNKKSPEKWGFLKYRSFNRVGSIALNSRIDTMPLLSDQIQESGMQQLWGKIAGHDLNHFSIYKPHLDAGTNQSASHWHPLPTNNPASQSRDKSLRFATVLSPGKSPQTFTTDQTTRMGAGPIKYLQVDPRSSVRSTWGDTGVYRDWQGKTSPDCYVDAAWFPTWQLISSDEENWGIDVVDLVLTGEIAIRPWPSTPDRMVVPNTPNPVDGGNINDEPDSPNYWKTVVNSLNNYNVPGYRKSDWYATDAIVAHEWAHWNIDLIEDAVMSNKGGNWPKLNSKLDAQREPKSRSPSRQDAWAALELKIEKYTKNFKDDVCTRFKAIPDSPGVAGSTGFIAGQKVLDSYIERILNYAAGKGWV